MKLQDNNLEEITMNLSPIGEEEGEGESGEGTGGGEDDPGKK